MAFSENLKYFTHCQLILPPYTKTNIFHENSICWQVFLIYTQCSPLLYIVTKYQKCHKIDDEKRINEQFIKEIMMCDSYHN